jgi:hypothetical protein
MWDRWLSLGHWICCTDSEGNFVAIKCLIDFGIQRFAIAVIRFPFIYKVILGMIILDTND